MTATVQTMTDTGGLREEGWVEAAFKTPPDKPAQRLFIPGPTDVHPATLAAQAAPMIGHRSDELEALFGKCSEQLQQLYTLRRGSSQWRRRGRDCKRRPSAMPSTGG